MREIVKPLNQPISITAIASTSPLGSSLEEAWEQYQQQQHGIQLKDMNGSETWVAPLSSEARQAIMALRNSDRNYKQLDDSVLFAIQASRAAVKAAGWLDEDFGVNIGSSRGATTLFETYHKGFMERGHAETLTSPTTTLGNISSWVAHDLQTKGPTISHSITCSTALHAMLNGIAWLRSGMADKFLVGGSEAPLTPFTIAQMRAMKIYAKHSDGQSDRVGQATQQYPCQALDLNKDKNTMVLGEGASMACLALGSNENALAIIEGFGYATEPLEHPVSISADAECFQRSMKMALGDISPDKVDVIVMHAPGTIKGDQSEYNAIQKVFGDVMPALTTNKWKLGHTFGASGMLSIEMAILMLQHQTFIPVPFTQQPVLPIQLEYILVNAVGFGGNAVSVLLRKP